MLSCERVSTSVLDRAEQNPDARAEKRKRHADGSAVSWALTSAARGSVLGKCGFSICSSLTSGVLSRSTSRSSASSTLTSSSSNHAASSRRSSLERPTTSTRAGPAVEGRAGEASRMDGMTSAPSEPLLPVVLDRLRLRSELAVDPGGLALEKAERAGDEGGERSESRKDASGCGGGVGVKGSAASGGELVACAGSGDKRAPASTPGAGALPGPVVAANDECRMVDGWGRGEAERDDGADEVELRLTRLAEHGSYSILGPALVHLNGGGRVQSEVSRNRADSVTRHGRSHSGVASAPDRTACSPHPSFSTSCVAMVSK